MSSHPPLHEICRHTFMLKAGFYRKCVACGYEEQDDDMKAMGQRIDEDNWRKQICIKHRPYKLPLLRPKVMP